MKYANDARTDGPPPQSRDAKVQLSSASEVRDGTAAWPADDVNARLIFIVTLYRNADGGEPGGRGRQSLLYRSESVGEGVVSHREEHLELERCRDDNFPSRSRPPPFTISFSLLPLLY